MPYTQIQAAITAGIKSRCRCPRTHFYALQKGRNRHCAVAQNTQAQLSRSSLNKALCHRRASQQRERKQRGKGRGKATAEEPTISESRQHIAAIEKAPEGSTATATRHGMKEVHGPRVPGAHFIPAPVRMGGCRVVAQGRVHIKTIEAVARVPGVGLVSLEINGGAAIEHGVE